MTEPLVFQPTEERRRQERQVFQPQRRPVFQPEQEEAGFFENTKRVVVGGLRDAAQSTMDALADVNNFFVNSLVESAVENESLPLVPESAELQKRFSKLEAPQLPKVREPTNLPARMARDVVQFTAGYLPISRAVATGNLARSIGGSAVTSALVFDPHEERLSNLIQKYPRLRNPVTDFLQADPDDSAALGRFKAALEDIPLGIASEGLIAGVRALRNARHMKAAQEASEFLERAEKPRVRVTQRPGEKPRVRPVTQRTKPPAPDAPPLSVRERPTPQQVTEPAARTFQQRGGGRQIEVAGNINLDRIDSPDEIKNALRVTATEEEGFTAARRGTISNEELKNLAAEAGMAESDLLRRRRGQALNAEQALRARTMLVDSATDLVARAKAANGGSDEALVAFREALNRHVAIQEQVAGMTAEAGRALQQFKVAAEGSDRARAIQNLIEQAGGRDALEDQARMLGALENPEQVARAARGMARPSLKDKLIEFWINGLLSGPQTHLTNIASNSLVMAYSVPERLVGAGFGALRGGDRIRFQEAGAFASGMFKGMRRATRDGLKVLVGQDVPVGTFKIETAHRQAIEGLKGKVIRTPGRALMAADVWFKTVNHAAEMEALAVRRALKEGLSGSALRQRVSDLLRNPPKDIAEQAWRRADINTFTTPLKGQEGVLADFANTFNNFANRHPLARFIVPFVRTPTNIFKFTYERTPLGLLMADTRKALRSGGPARQEALAKMTMGTTIMGGVMSYAADGQISGWGPTDPEERQALYRTGWQPYSVKIGDTWHSYQRLEPLGTIVGLAADLVDMGARLGEDEKAKLSVQIVGAISNNVLNKTFMRGASEMINALEDPERWGDRFTQNFLGSLVIPTGAAQLARAQDPVLRDVRGITDKIMTRVPGLSGDVAPMLNLWGEEIRRDGPFAVRLLSPVYLSKDAKDKLNDEMVDLQVTPGMPNRRINGIDLSPEQYNEYVRLAGQPAKQILDRIVGTAGWQSLPDFAKQNVIERIITQFRAQARTQMVIRHPELLQGQLNQSIPQAQ